MIPLRRPRLRIRPAHASPSHFRADESGAVTVDWVVLCALVTALTVAMHDEVGAALGFFADDVTEELTESEIVREGETGTVGYDFDGGYGGRWSGASPVDIDGFGFALGPIAGSGGRESVTHDFIVGSGVKVATLRFDVLSLDSLDGEDGVIYINGAEVGRVTTYNGNPVFSSSNVPGITVEARVVASNEDFGGMSGGGDDTAKDAITVITISVDDPGDSIAFGFGSTADEDVENESYALDNFQISGVASDAESAPESDG
ncbi:hypothetical protein [Jannaschia sp. W003]|uniref:hypothetical protein n=1 Tax=Jannaschia sp. W003 TaxID=2867012 RepID=UPI0021A48899|nr:hypothetical protein [Jannaschia sp. W003]UWQ21114.1 hypothetical protein K3554_14230 [Jannaschia sp. W003]